jgi:hypothetical protein
MVIGGVILSIVGLVSLGRGGRQTK